MDKWKVDSRNGVFIGVGVRKSMRVFENRKEFSKFGYRDEGYLVINLIFCFLLVFLGDDKFLKNIKNFLYFLCLFLYLFNYVIFIVDILINVYWVLNLLEKEVFWRFFGVYFIYFWVWVVLYGR